MSTLIAIGRLAAFTGVKIPTIRYYESVGLLPAPSRSEANRRLYGDETVRRLRFIRHARELGFEVGDIRQLLALTDEPDRPCDEVDAIARRHLAEIQSRIRRLNALKAEVSRMINQCAQGKVADCRIIDVLGHHEYCLHDTHFEGKYSGEKTSAACLASGRAPGSTRRGVTRTDTGGQRRRARSGR